MKAAPNPSEKYGETVCVAGLSVDLTRRGWVRLYPINFRELGVQESFRKYDVVTVDAVPARQDPRNESWRPIAGTLQVEHHLDPWKPRRSWLDPYVEDSMCALNRNARTSASSQSLALVRPREVLGLEIAPHPGWTPDEQKKIKAYESQLDLFEQKADRSPLEAPRYKGAYRYLCHAKECGTHRQGLLDWEFVALQRKLGGYDDDAARRELTTRFFAQMCAQDREVAFYVGNQAKRAHVFSVLGVYYPKR
ncbi:hypothetical protein [Kibdelosporangium aridum]|uniref:hypothetical protein n=1 Tax=Kibdelosporangium aridum TaxID=2030 RepID=UPI0035EB5BD6